LPFRQVLRGRRLHRGRVRPKLMDAPTKSHPDVVGGAANSGKSAYSKLLSF
jgi:hypothetical protein